MDRRQELFDRAFELGITVNSKPFEQSINETVKWNGMVQNALDDLVKNIGIRANILAPFATRTADKKGE